VVANSHLIRTATYLVTNVKSIGTSSL